MKLRMLIIVSLLVGSAACSDNNRIPDEPDGNVDADIQRESDTDLPIPGGGDADSDPDFDGDTEDDGDFNNGERWTPTADGASGSLCGNDIDDDEDGLSDCQDLGCLTAPHCCGPIDRTALRGDFSTCVDGLEGCGWSAFAAVQDGDAVRQVDDLVVFGGDGVGEVGLYSQPITGLAGEPTLSFVAALDAGSCSAGACRQAFGVALTDQRSLTSGTGVQPTVGVVLDGEQAAVHLMVGGRRERSILLDDAMVLTEPHLYGFRVHPDGAVSFWVMEPATDFGTPSSFEGTPEVRSDQTVTVDVRSLRVVAFGRLEGASGAALHQIELSRRVCDLPDGWQRPSSYPVLRPAGSLGDARSPTVIELDDQLLMIYESDARLAMASSLDRGQNWTDEGRLLQLSPSTRYGGVSQREPTALAWSRDPSELHLWYVGEATRVPDDPPGGVPTAILHAVSSDGIEWLEDEAPIAIEADGSHRWLFAVGSPSVIETDEGLVMWLVGHSDWDILEPEILVATSSDGKHWSLEEAPVEFDSARPLAFERSGRFEPMVIARAGALQMWYVGRDGARSAIGYAVSADGRLWDRYGPVLIASQPWEANRTSGPTVLDEETAETDLLRMWYDAGLAGRERIGLVTREVPPS